ERRGEGIYGVAVKVPNLEKAIEDVHSRGIRTVGTLQMGKLKEVRLHPKDCYGVMIEMCEYKAEHPLLVASLS
ncbi:hypothetical protein ACFLWX_04715, partial [Chloroflexota bacterium]